MPSSSSLNEFWPESKQFVAVPHGLQRSIGSPNLAIYVGFNLLVALCAPTGQKSWQYRGSAPFEQQYPWILDILNELWHYFRRWTTGYDKCPLHDDTIALYIQLVDTLAVPSPQLTSRFSNSDKAVLASSSSVSSLIESLATSSMTDENQIRLALTVTRLFHVAQVETVRRGVLDRRHRSSRSCNTGLLKQSATGICENTDIFSALQKDLQVRIRRHRISHATNAW